MKFLITGGSGLIGSHLIPLLLNEGHEVINLGRSAKKQYASPNFKSLIWNGKAVPAEAPEVDVVINLAGTGVADKPWTPAYKKLIADSRYDSTNACVAYIQRCEQKPKLFIAASAVGYYGTKHKQPVDETAAPGDDFLAKICAQWEKLAEPAGIRTVWLRTGVVLAKDGGAFPKLLAPFRFYAGGYIGDGAQGFPWVHIDDVMGIIQLILNNDAISGPVNIAAPEMKSNKSFGQALGAAIGKAVHFAVPAWVINIFLGERAIILAEGQFVLPKAATNAGYVFKYPDAKAAIANLLKP